LNWNRCCDWGFRDSYEQGNRNKLWAYNHISLGLLVLIACVEKVMGIMNIAMFLGELKFLI